MLFLFILFVKLLYAISHTYTSILKTILSLIIFEFAMNVAIDRLIFSNMFLLQLLSI